MKNWFLLFSLAVTLGISPKSFAADSEKSIHSFGGYETGYGNNVFSMLAHLPLCSGFDKIKDSSNEHVRFTVKCRNRRSYIDKNTVEVIAEFEGTVTEIGAGPYVSNPIKDAKGLCSGVDKVSALKSAVLDLVRPPDPKQQDFKMTYRCEGTTAYLIID